MARRGSTNNAMGGTIITNNSGEKVFLPAAGWRNNIGASLGTGPGYYLSSSVTSTRAYILAFSSASVYPGTDNSNYRAMGCNVRCVSE